MWCSELGCISPPWAGDMLHCGTVLCCTATTWHDMAPADSECVAVHAATPLPLPCPSADCPWPRELFRHQRACIETVDELQEAAGMAMSSTRTPNPQECLSPLHSAPLPDVAPSGMSDILPTVSPSGASTAMLTSMACHINDSQATMTLDP